LNQFTNGIAGMLRESIAYAAEAAEPQTAQGGPMGLVLPIALFVVIFYFLMYRPQKKKQQQHEKMISSIGRGDTVVTAGGFFGKVCDVLEDSFIVEIAEGVRVRIQKNSISVRRETSDAKPKSGRQKKRRKRPVEGGESASLPGVGVTGEVTADESDALMEPDAPESAERDEETGAPDEKTDEADESKSGENVSGGAPDDKKG